MNKESGLGEDFTVGSHHYRAFVGSPEKYDLIGAIQFSLLTFLGLREKHSLLDVGCGSLRAGRLLMPYLLPGNYFGIEPEQWLLETTVKNQIGADMVRIKKPTFSNDKDFTLSIFDQRFDFILAFSIFSHSSQSQIRRCLSEAKKVMKSTTVFVATFLEGDENYTGDCWSYPDCVTYTLGHMKALANEQGMVCKPIGWPTGNRQRWIGIVQPENEEDFTRVNLEQLRNDSERLKRLERHPYVRFGSIVWRMTKRFFGE